MNYVILSNLHHSTSEVPLALSYIWEISFEVFLCDAL